MQEDQIPILSTPTNLDQIPVEEVYGKEVYMSIDTAHFAEDIITLLTFLGILFITLFSGYFGKKAVLIETASDNFETKENSTSPPRFAYSIFNISKATRFIDFTLILQKKPEVVPSQGNFSVFIEKNGPDFHTDSFDKTFSPINAFFLEGKIDSEPISIYKDMNVNYHYLSASLKFNDVNKDYHGFKVFFHISNPENVLYQIVFRVLFGISLLAFFILMVYRLKETKPKFWHLEQKLTVGLLFVGFLYNHFLYGTRIVSWYVCYFIDSFVRGLEIAYVIFFLLTLFDSLRFKNREVQNFFYLPKSILSFIVGSAVFVHGFLQALDDYKVFHVPVSPLQLNLMWIIRFGIATALLYLFIIIILSFINVDPTEKFKFNLYVLSVTLSFLSILIGYFLKEGNSLSFTIEYAIVSMFSILMAYFHWPYEVIKDQVYDEQNENQLHSIPDSTFFVNEDENA